jgi:hypothetical protein
VKEWAMNIPSGFRIETETLGFERITWLVHPAGGCRALLRTEWIGPELTPEPPRREPSRKKLLAIAEAARELIEAMEGDWVSESTERVERLHQALVDAGLAPQTKE